MIPGVNMRQAQQMMRKMGIVQQEVDADVVIIRSSTKEIVIHQPQVTKVNMMGQETYQVVGQSEEHDIDTKPEVSEEDIRTVMEQAGVSKEAAKEALEKSSGDLAAAILSLSS